MADAVSHVHHGAHHAANTTIGIGACGSQQAGHQIRHGCQWCSFTEPAHLVGGHTEQIGQSAQTHVEHVGHRCQRCGFKPAGQAIGQACQNSVQTAVVVAHQSGFDHIAHGVDHVAHHGHGFGQFTQIVGQVTDGFCQATRIFCRQGAGISTTAATTAIVIV